MGGATLLLPLYAFMEWPGRTGHNLFRAVSVNEKWTRANLRLWDHYSKDELAACSRGRYLAVATVRRYFTVFVTCVVQRLREAKRSKYWYVKLVTFVSCSLGMFRGEHEMAAAIMSSTE